MTTLTKEQREALQTGIATIGEMQAPIQGMIKPYVKQIQDLEDLKEFMLQSAGIVGITGECEGCSCLIVPGDKVHTSAEGHVLCQTCSPTYGDVYDQYFAMDEPELQKALDEDRSKDDIMADFDGHDLTAKSLTIFGG